MKIFLSHSSRDKPLIREIQSYLPQHIKTWIDEEELLFGDEIENSLRKAIKLDADFLVIFVGREAIQSKWVKKELNWALEHEQRIGRTFVLPVVFDTDVWDQVEPKEFQNRKYLECTDFTSSGVKLFSEKFKDELFAWLSRSRLLGSERAKAILRLHGVASMLRDTLISVQRDALAVFSDETKFERLKQTATTQVKKIAESFKQDAEVARIEERLRSLTDVTTAAILDIPFPGKVIAERETSRDRLEEIDLAVRHLKGLPNDLLEGALGRFASNEIKEIVARLTKQYEKWWDKHYLNLHESTTQVEESLFLASMQLASTTEYPIEIRKENGGGPGNMQKLGSAAIEPAETASEETETSERSVGNVTHYYEKIGVAAVHLDGHLAVGDRIKFVSRNWVDLFEQDVTSIRIDDRPVASAESSQHITLTTTDRVAEGTRVFKT